MFDGRPPSLHEGHSRSSVSRRPPILESIPETTVVLNQLRFTPQWSLVIDECLESEEFSQLMHTMRPGVPAIRAVVVVCLFHAIRTLSNGSMACMFDGLGTHYLRQSLLTERWRADPMSSTEADDSISNGGAIRLKVCFPATWSVVIVLCFLYSCNPLPTSQTKFLLVGIQDLFSSITITS